MAIHNPNDFHDLDQTVRQSFESTDEFPQDLYSMAPGSRNFTKTGISGRKFMLIRLRNHCFAVPLSCVREVLGLPKVSSLPNMPDYFAGLINLRGKIVSAIQLQISLKNVVKPEARGQAQHRPCVVITDYQSRLFGAIIDDVVSVVQVGEESIDHSMDNVANAEYFDGIIKFQNGILAPILNLEKALKIEELIRMEEGKTAA